MYACILCDDMRAYTPGEFDPRPCTVYFLGVTGLFYKDFTEVKFVYACVIMVDYARALRLPGLLIY